MSFKQLAVKVVPDMDSGLYTPGAPIKIKVEGDAGTRVRLVTLDKGVYIRNKQYRIAQTKVWKERPDADCN